MTGTDTESRDDGAPDGLAALRDGLAAAPGYFLREEAHAMTWQQLFAAEQRGVRDLLLRMLGAMDAAGAGRAGGQRHLAPCFLLAGPRGTGKTTVLANTRSALEVPDQFFGAAGEHEEDLRCILGDAAVPSPNAWRNRPIDRLRHHVIWLDSLDMEFFPEGGNLLTALLVRVRGALEPSPHAEIAEGEWGRAATADDPHLARRGAIPAQLIEEGEADAWAKIGSLITNATLMWEEVSESNVRVQAERQIESAETNAAFRADFNAALEAVAQELAQRRLGRTGRDIALVLPIDNADRSARHIAQVIKLARMVSSPNVWYVLAGSDCDLDLFLEQSYRDQLGVRDTGAAGPARGYGAGSANRIVGIARRQAASDARSVLPPANRVSIECVNPAEALRFPERGQLHGCEQGSLQLFEVLRQLEMGSTADAVAGGARAAAVGGAAPAGWRPSRLLDLLVLDSVTAAGLDGRMIRPPARPAEGAAPDCCPVIMSQAGEMALRLPARSILDLYQLARMWLGRQVEARREERAGEPRPCAWAALGLVRDMLENAVAESDLPEWACRMIVERLIFEDGVGRICLDLRGDPLGWRSRVHERAWLDLPRPPAAASAGPGIAGNRPQIVLYDYYGYRLFVRHDGDEIELPPQVAGWLMILHDILQAIPEPRIIEDVGHPDRESPLLVQTQHRAAIWRTATGRWESPLVRMTWPPPRFYTFFSHDLFARRWARLVDVVLPALKDDLGRLSASLILGWAEVSRSVAAGERVGSWRPEDVLLREPEVAARILRHYEENKLSFVPAERAFRRWIEWELFRLLQPEIRWTCGAPGPGLVAGAIEAFWNDHTERLYERRWYYFKEAVRASELYQRQAEQMRLRCGLDYLQLEGWLDEACRQWFDAIDAMTAQAGVGGRDWRPREARRAPHGRHRAPAPH
jgi:hypothetical protein